MTFRKYGCRSVGGWSEDEKKKKHHPEGVVDAQFSIPYTVAATLVSGGLSLEEFTDVKLRSEEILDLAARVKTLLTPEFDHGPMDVKPQVVEIVMRDGKVQTDRPVTRRFLAPDEVRKLKSDE